MVSIEQFQTKTTDPLLDQAETIFSQRQSRALMIDPEILGEPGWDILLCAFIAHRKGKVCSLNNVASEISSSLSTTKRWVELLTLRKFLVEKDGFFAITEEAEHKLSIMFKKQIKEVIQAISLAQQRHEDEGRRKI
jgi:hypothetical protein